jgi:O-antigen/teichoic acid export membrane protein
MQRKFLGNLALIQALNWLIKPVWIFWIERLTQIRLGDEWYGRYFIIFSFGLLFNILLDFGLNTYVASVVGRSGNPAMARPVLKLRLILCAAYILLVLALGLLQHFDPIILGIAIFNQLLAGFILFFRAILQGRHHFKTDSFISITDRAIAIIICAFFIYGSKYVGRNGIIIFLLAQSAGYTVSLVISALFAFKNTQQLPHLVVEEKFQTLFKQTAWFAVLAFAMSFFTRIDAWMIHNLAKNSDAEAGLYAQSFRLLDAALIFSSLISAMLLPLFSRSIGEKKSTDTLVWLSSRIVLFVAIPAALYAAFFGADILQILYHNRQAGSATLLYSASIFMPLMACFIPMALVHVFGTWLTAAGKVKYLSFIAFLCMAINIGLNFYFIPELGALGAAWSCLITQLVFVSGCLMQCMRLNAFAFHWNRLLKLTIWIIFSIINFYFCQKYLHHFTALIFAAAGFICATIISGLFNTELRKIFSLKMNNN